MRESEYYTQRKYIIIFLYRKLDLMFVAKPFLC